jgi:hypothetical protein
MCAMVSVGVRARLQERYKACDGAASLVAIFLPEVLCIRRIVDKARLRYQEIVHLLGAGFSRGILSLPDLVVGCWVPGGATRLSLLELVALDGLSLTGHCENSDLRSRTVAAVDYAV